MNEKKYIITIGMLLVVCIMLAAILINRTDEYSGRVRDASARVDALAGELGNVQSEIDERNATVIKFITDQQTEITGIKQSIGDGTRNLAERIRSVAARVEIMENNLRMLGSAVSGTINMGIN